MRKQDTYMCCLQEIPLIARYTQTKSKGMEEDISCKWKRKKARVILISDKIDFETKAIVRDKEGHYIMIKGTIQQEDITLVNIYTANIGAPKYVKQNFMDTKEATNRNTVIVRDFNTSLISLDRSSR